MIPDKIRTKFARHTDRAAKFFATQLCVTLVSWPLMLEWGLPVSILSPIGNAIFNPFVTLFLALCALITGAEITNIPHGLLSSCLEQLTSIWLTIVRIAPPGLILTLKKPPLLLSLCAPIGTIIIMHSRRIKGLGRKIGALSLLFVLLTVLFALIPLPGSIPVPYGSQTITVTYDKKTGSLVALDTGFTRRCASADSWLAFTLLPQLSIHFGRQTIDQYVCKKLTPAVSHLLELLCEKELIRELCLPPEPVTNRSAYKKMRNNLEAIAHSHQITIK